MRAPYALSFQSYRGTLAGARRGVLCAICAVLCIACGKETPKPPKPKPQPPAGAPSAPKSQAQSGVPSAASSTPPPSASSSPVSLPDTRVFKTAEGQVESVDPNLISESAGNRIGTQMFETLVQPSPDGQAIVPAQAAEWATSQDGKTWTFTLRDGLQWSDGKAITTADFLYSYEQASIR